MGIAGLRTDLFIGLPIAFGAREKRSRKYSSGVGKKPVQIDVKQMRKQPPCFGPHHSSFPSHLEAFAEVKLTADRIVDQKVFCTLAFDAAFVNQICAIHDR